MRKRQKKRVDGSLFVSESGQFAILNAREIGNRAAYICKGDENAFDHLTIRIEALRALARFFRRVNKQHRQGMVTAILSPYWQREADSNLASDGLPFPEAYFVRLRRLIYYLNKRLKALSSGKAALGGEAKTRL